MDELSSQPSGKMRAKPIIRIQNLNKDDAKYNFSPENHEEKYLVRNSDLLFAWSASLGAYIWQGGDAWLNQHIFIVHPKSCTTKLFVFYLLEKITAELYAKAHGSGMVHVTKGKFESTEIFLPPLNEQNRIVAKIEELFSELDKGIENLKTARTQLKVYRQALLKHAFEGKLTAQWRAEHQDKLETANALLKRIQQERAQRYQQQLSDWEAADKQGSKPKAPKPLLPLTAEELAELPELPEGWIWIKFGELCEKIFDGTHFSPKSFPTGKYKYITAKNIKENRLDLSNITYLDEDAHREIYSRCDVQFNDVLYIKDGATTGVAVVNKLEEEFSLLSSVGVFRFPKSAVVPEYAAYFLNSNVTRHRMLKEVAGVAITRLTLVKLNRAGFALPSLGEQNQIVQELESKLSEVDQLEQTITTSLQQAEALRQSILKRAFSGQLVAQDANDEPAPVLLERIKAEREMQPITAKPRKLQKVQPKPAPVKTNVIPFPVRLANISTTDLHAGILARAYQHHEHTPKYLANFGHVKAEKIVHLVEAHLGIDLEREPVKAAAGPNDFLRLINAESRAKKMNWFDVRKQEDGAYVLTKRINFDALLLKTRNALGERADEVDALINKLLPLNRRQAEIVATLYAAWNNLLLLGCSSSDEDIVSEARENWHDSKLKIERDKFFRGLKWMHEQKLVPAGKGRHVGAKAVCATTAKKKSVAAVARKTRRKAT